MSRDFFRRTHLKYDSKPRCLETKADPEEPDHDHTCQKHEGHLNSHRCNCSATWRKTVGMRMESDRVGSAAQGQTSESSSLSPTANSHGRVN